MKDSHRAERPLGILYCHGLAGGETARKSAKSAWGAKLSEDETVPVFASIGAGESDLNGADSETWLRENWK